MIGAICTKPAVTATADMTVREAARRMATRKIGALVVVDARGRPIGVVTDRDITTKVVAFNKNPAQIRVGALVRRDPVVIDESASIADATRQLARSGVRRLPVVDSSSAVIGIISLDDLMIMLGSELGRLASALASELGRPKP